MLFLLLINMFSMKVVNAKETDGLAPHAIFILPYQLFDENRIIRSRIMVFEGMVTPCIHLNREGLYSHGYESFFGGTKDLEVTYSGGVQRQIDGFLGLLRRTKGHPVSIIQVENPLRLLPELIITDLAITYIDQFMEENGEGLDEMRPRAVETGMKACYDPQTSEGLKRRAENTTVTAYYGVPEPVLRMMGEITHLGRELSFDYV